MLPLYILNLAAAVLLLLWPYWFSRVVLHLPKLNPLSIVMLVTLPIDDMKLFGGPLVLIEQGLWDEGFQYAVLMNSLLTTAQIASTCIVFKIASAFRFERFLPFRNTHLKPSHLRRGTLLFLVFFAVNFSLLASAQLGILEWLRNPRTGYQLYRTGQGHWFALALNCLSVATLLAFCVKLRPTSILLKAVCMLGIAYFLGSKSILLTIFVSTMVILWFIRWRHLGKLLLLGGPLVFILLAWNLYLALLDSFELQSLVEYFDYYKNAADYYRSVLTGNVQLFYGEIISSSFWSYVPRALVPDKPFVYGIILVNEIFYPGQAEMTNTPAFGGAVEQYADFGVIGVVILGLLHGQTILNAVLYYCAFRRPGIDLRNLTVGQFLVLLMLFGPMFGIYFPGLLYWLILSGVVISIVLMRFRLGTRPMAPAAPVPH